jgi:2-aminoethylphosphonate-pyruvate transaminase
MVQIAGRLRIPVTAWRCPEDRRPDLDGLQRALDEDRAISHVALVHCETSTGILNPLAEVGRIVKPAGRVFVVDAMSSFGAVPVNLAEAGIDYLVSSANKCLEGVPGFSFVLARREAMLAAEGSARSLSLDLQAQWRGLEADGQFRFTPPTHAILALARALDELEAEGGLAARAARYRANHTTLIDGMRRLGFREYLAPALQSDVITAFHYPADPNFRFEEFYRRLAAGGMVIYPGKLSSVDCFRIGTIGRIDAGDVAALLKAIAAVLAEMKVPVPVA